MWSAQDGQCGCEVPLQNIHVSGAEVLGEVRPCISSGDYLESRFKFLFHHQLPFVKNLCTEAHILKCAKMSRCHYDLLHTLRLFLMVQEYSCWNNAVSLFPRCFFLLWKFWQAITWSGNTITWSGKLKKIVPVLKINTTVVQGSVLMQNFKRNIPLNFEVINLPFL